MASFARTTSSVSHDEAVRIGREEEPGAIADLVGKLADEHNEWHGRSLNLVASHNLVSPKAKALLNSKLIDNTTAGGIGTRSHSGGVGLDRIETLYVELAKRLFGVPYVEYRAPSGATSNGIFIFAATEPGDRMMSLSVQYGGHYSYRDHSYAGQKSLQFFDLPCYGDDYPVVNLELLSEEAEKVKPRWIMVGSATSLFPYPVREISDIARGVGAEVFFDGAHILGLAAGGQFQNPLQEGASVMTGSTQKTLAGPVGGLVLMHDGDLAERVQKMTPNFIASYNNSRTAAMVVTLAEMLAFGKEYASAIVANSQALARELEAQGVKAVGKDRGYTQSHIVLVDLTETPGGEEAFHRLEASHISCSRTDTPGTYPHQTALRLGTPACSRLGMGVEEMKEVARLIRRAVIDQEDSVTVGRDVAELAAGFPEVKYCF